MERRRLGRGEVAAVGLGAMSFGGFYGPTTEADSHATLAAMLDLGMDHVDTSFGF
jgi:aryl-alcohol dehydrogenase-like predicted oxidoreductase